MGNTQAQGKASKGAPSRAGRQPKYARYRVQSRHEKAMLVGLRAHLVGNPNDAAAKAKVKELTDAGFGA